MKPVVVVTATRATLDGFRQSTPLGQSLERIGPASNLRCLIACENSSGLSDVYNRAITEAYRESILLFVHDDVFIDDFWLVWRLNAAVAHFGLVGLVGNVRLAPTHVGWAFAGIAADGKPLWDRPENLSGAVRHRLEGRDVISHFGPAPQACELLDGLFLAAPAAGILDRDIRFDPRFSWNFYDLDFFRSCTRVGLTAGTWPIAVSHGSAGRFGSPLWQQELAIYREKWG